MSGLRLNLQRGIANWQIRAAAIAALGLGSSHDTRRGRDYSPPYADNYRTGYREGWNSTRTDRPTSPPRPTPY